MSNLNQQLKLALLKRKKSGNSLEQGFTLVELMVVIVIVGILSAVALPNFLGQASKAKAIECITKGGSIMGLVGADALISEASGTATLAALITEANANSSLCTFSTTTGPTSDGVYAMTAEGKGDLLNLYDGAFCVNYKTGKKETATTYTGTPPTAPTCL